MRNLIIGAMILASLFQFANVRAQHLTHDIGFHLDMLAIQTDYGARNDFSSSYGNRALSISLSHTVHFFNNDLRWNYDHPIWSHLAIRNELSIVTKVRLKHHGRYVDGSSIVADQLRAMTGSTQMLSMGFQLEYYSRCLKDFLYPWSDWKWNPYVLAGLRYNRFKTDLNSSLGDWRQNPSVLPEKWRPSEAVSIGKGKTFSTVFGGGLRYKLNSRMNLNAQLSWHFFFSDAVDGLQADVVENQDNEWSVNFQVGLIYHLNYLRPLKVF
jgi:opacity protein-like surface antigen